MTETIPSPPPSNEEALHLLEDLVVDNADLRRLEDLLEPFNIFEAIGMTQQEIRHSRFLAFLMDPRRPHGLGDLFLRRFLQKALLAARGTQLAISLVDLDVWNLADAFAQTEWGNIDVLILDDTNDFAVIVENKVWTGEHDDQLAVYWDRVARHRPGAKIVGLYLTPNGDAPSHDGYVAVRYEVVVAVIEDLLATFAASISGDVRTVLQHYVDMLRRQILRNEEIDELCQRVYRKHQRALDLIFERRPDRQSEVRLLIEELVGQNPGYEIDRSNKWEVLFVPSEWDTFLPVTEDRTWSPHGHVLNLWFENTPTRLRLGLFIGPGPQQVRERFFDAAREHQPPFKPAGRTLKQKWNRIYHREFVDEASYQGADIDTLREIIRQKWEAFVETDLPRITAILRDVVWVAPTEGGN